MHGRCENMKIFKYFISKIFLRKAVLGIGMILLLCMANYSFGYYYWNNDCRNYVKENQKNSNFFGGITMTKIIDLSIKEKTYKSKNYRHDRVIRLERSK